MFCGWYFFFLACLPEATRWWNSQWCKVPGKETVCLRRSPRVHNSCQVTSLKWQDLSNRSLCKLHWQYSQDKVKNINIHSKNPWNKQNEFTVKICQGELQNSYVGFWIFNSFLGFAVELQWLFIIWVEIKLIQVMNIIMRKYSWTGQMETTLFLTDLTI